MHDDGKALRVNPGLRRRCNPGSGGFLYSHHSVIEACEENLFTGQIGIELCNVGIFSHRRGSIEAEAAGIKAVTHCRAIGRITACRSARTASAAGFVPGSFP